MTLPKSSSIFMLLAVLFFIVMLVFMGYSLKSKDPAKKKKMKMWAIVSGVLLALSGGLASKMSD